MRSLFFSVIIFFSLNANAGFFWKDLEFISMENFSVDRKDGRVYLGFDYVINNPNWYGILMKPSSMFLKIADVDCGWVRIEEKTKLKRKHQGAYPFVLVGDASKFVKSGFSSIWALLTGQGVSFNLKGNIKGGVAGITKKFPLDYTYKMSFEEFLSLF